MRLGARCPSEKEEDSASIFSSLESDLSGLRDLFGCAADAALSSADSYGRLGPSICAEKFINVKDSRYRGHTQAIAPHTTP